ncbi:MAG TPA: cytochrome C oxidase subunit IV family protein [Acidimicrobiales bacterium]|jgi:cytochrome c oxidase subunit IV|nr:cytochrome C oxidase subunit IV family protein [Acidimicrobiales bacterium]
MSDDTMAEAAAEEYQAQTEHEGHDHPSERSYVVIAIVLALLTALEVATFYVEEQLGGLLVPSLMVMMVVKFFLVVAWFMHLRFDGRLFTRVFVSGLVLAVGVYAVALTTFRFW